MNREIGNIVRGSAFLIVLPVLFAALFALLYVLSRPAPQIWP